MNKHDNFFTRGVIGAAGGPVILATVYLCIYLSGALPSVETDKLVIAILTSSVMAFIAGGISVVHKVERLSPAMKALIHMVVLYVDYLGFYLINGFLPENPTSFWIFTAIFFVGFLIIWAIIYFVEKAKTNKLNRAFKK